LVYFDVSHNLSHHLSDLIDIYLVEKLFKFGVMITFMNYMSYESSMMSMTMKSLTMCKALSYIIQDGKAVFSKLKRNMEISKNKILIPKA